MRVAPQVQLSPDVRDEIERLIRARTTPARVVERARIVMLAAEGEQDIEIADALDVTRQTAARWRSRFLARGLEGIVRDDPRPGRPATIRKKVEAEIVRRTIRETPKNATHWSARSMAVVAGVSEKTVRRIWRRHGLKPHRVRTFKLSKDPQFVEKLEDIVGLYLSPPEHAVVLSADEKSQIQALDRTQPGLPFNEGHLATVTHDYSRHGTTTLFAALNVLDGNVIGTCMQRHRHKEWLKFLRLIDAQVPDGQGIHLIVDNYATHKHEAVKRWLAKHPRFHVHFTPTGASWLNQVERFFRDISERKIRRGTFGSVKSLVRAINEYLEINNQAPRPFIWTAKASDILEKVKRARSAFGTVKSKD